MNKPIILTFSGYARSGKDSSVIILKELLEQKGKRVLHINYADYLKYLAKSYFNWNGKKDEQGRTLLQWIGTEKVRNVIPNFWVDNVINTVKVFQDDFDYVLIGDCRFENEVYRWDREGFKVIPIHVERLNFENNLTEEQKNHPSETAMNGYDFSIYLKAENLGELKNEVITKVLEVID